MAKLGELGITLYDVAVLGVTVRLLKLRHFAFCYIVQAPNSAQIQAACRVHLYPIRWEAIYWSKLPAWLHGRCAKGKDANPAEATRRNLILLKDNMHNDRISVK